MLVKLLTAERHLGRSPLGKAVGFATILAVVLVLILHHRGVDVVQKIDRAYQAYFGGYQIPWLFEGDAQSPSDSANAPIVKARDSSDSAEPAVQLVHTQELPNIPRIALHPFNYSQFRKHHANGSELAELINSLLMIELSKSDEFELLDRTLVSAMFAERSQLLGEDNLASDRAAFEKLPLSDFTLVGSVFSNAGQTYFTLKITRNSTGQVVGAASFPFQIDRLQKAIQQSLIFVHKTMDKSHSIAKEKQLGSLRNVAFGHFVDISDQDSNLAQGRMLTARLIEKYTHKKNYRVLSRTQVFPLVFEEYLRMLQYTDEHNESRRQNADYLIYGKYRMGGRHTENPLSIYLYIDLIEYGRELIVLNAANWEDAYTLVDKTVTNYLPQDISTVSAENIEESRKMFLEALKTRGLYFVRSELSGKEPPSSNAISGFKSQHKSENIAPARELIEKSLDLNPDNAFSKLASAMFLVSEQKHRQSRAILKELLWDGPPIASIAHELLQKHSGIRTSGIAASDFDDVVAPDQVDQVHHALIAQRYLKKVGDRVIFNSEDKSHSLFQDTHKLNLRGFPPDISIRVFEKLRTLVHSPGSQVKFLPPNPFNRRAIKNKRQWYQLVSVEKHNAEALLHYDVARAQSSFHIVQATTIPFIAAYAEADLESEIRRRTNLEFAVDGFAASAYLDTSYLKSLILLGHALCQDEVGRCASGRAMHAWLVDHTKAADLKGRGGLYFNIGKDVEERDNLIFLAADAIDRVDDAQFSDMFKTTLGSSNYLTDKFKKRLDRVLHEVGTPTSDKDIERVVLAYGKLIEAQCIELLEDRRKLRSISRMLDPGKALAALALQNEKVALLRKKLVTDLAQNYPSVYPHLLLEAKPSAPFIAKEQDAMVARVAAGEIVPVELTEFMEAAVRIFGARLASNNIAVAKRYIQYFEKHYGINSETAIDFAYLHYRVGNFSHSNKLLEDFRKDSFRIKEFSFKYVDGEYRHNGFEGKGELIYTRHENRDVYFVYSPYNLNYGLGEHNYKWRFYDKKPTLKYPKGTNYFLNRNAKSPELFAFGNGGRIAGKIIWPHMSSDIATKYADASARENIGLTVAKFIEVMPLDESRLNKKSSRRQSSENDYFKVKTRISGTQKQAEKSTEELIAEGYYIGARKRHAVKGFPNKTTTGPLRDSYFPARLSKKRKISVVKEALFQKGYLTVEGQPVYDTEKSLQQRIQRDFSNFDSSEQWDIVRALKATRKVSGAGYVKVYQYDGSSWKLDAALIPEDAMSQRSFGLATVVDGNLALVCDYKDGLYSFKKISEKWVQQARIQVRCHSLAMNGDWAAVGSAAKVFLYRNNNGLLQEVQVLKPANYLVDKDKGHNFRGFGGSLAITDDSIFVGNPYGGANNRGQVYIFNLTRKRWKQVAVLQPNVKASAFGDSISATENFLLVGDTSTGEPRTPRWGSGSVYIFTKENSGWEYDSQLVPKDRPKHAKFGRNVHLAQENKLEITIASKKDVYRHYLPN